MQASASHKKKNSNAPESKKTRRRRNGKDVERDRDDVASAIKGRGRRSRPLLRGVAGIKQPLTKWVKKGDGRAGRRPSKGLGKMPQLPRQRGEGRKNFEAQSRGRASG